MAVIKFRIFCRWCKKFLKWTNSKSTTKSKAKYTICNECKEGAFRNHR
jgi:RNase P subunit RPR2